MEQPDNLSSGETIADGGSYSRSLLTRPDVQDALTVVAQEVSGGRRARWMQDRHRVRGSGRPGEMGGAEGGVLARLEGLVYRQVLDQRPPGHARLPAVGSSHFLGQLGIIL